MNLLHVIHRYYPYVGGSEQVMQELSERFAREGHRVSVYTTDAWDLEHFWMSGKRRIETSSETHNGVEIHRFPVRRLPLSPFAYPALRRLMALVGRLPVNTKPLLFFLARVTPRVPQLDRALDTLDASVDLVHVANISLDSLVYAAYRLSRRRRIPLVITPFMHLGEPGDRRVRRAYTMPHQIEMLRQADAVIVQTELEQQALQDFGVPASKIHCIGVGVNPEFGVGGRAERFRAKYQVEGPIVFSVGAAAFDKGTMHVVKAMEKLWAQNLQPVPTLVIAGPALSPFQRFIAGRSADTQRRTRVLGFIADEDKRDLFAAGDVLVLPSRMESFGIVYLEAWLYNKPVIGALAGGVPAVISEGQNGFLVPFGDTQALAARIAQLLQDGGLAARLGQAGHVFVQSRWTWDQKFVQVRDLYQQVLMARSRR
ncbi:MAG: glycosyltransferase family 4 protein [Anaerolineae bacterium]